MVVEVVSEGDVVADLRRREAGGQHRRGIAGLVLEIGFVAGDQGAQPGTGQTAGRVVETAIEEGGFMLGRESREKFYEVGGVR